MIIVIIVMLTITLIKIKGEKVGKIRGEKGENGRYCAGQDRAAPSRSFMSLRAKVA